MKIRPVGAELFHSDGRTDTTKLIVVYRYFAKALKNVRSLKIEFNMKCAYFFLHLLPETFFHAHKQACPSHATVNK
jgi:hypothetical protein